MQVPGGPSSRSASPRTRRVVERRRSRRGRALAWSLKMVGNAILRPFGRHFVGSQVVQVAWAIVSGVLVAALIDLTLTPRSPALLYFVVGAVAGGGAQGPGGALVGGCWGWLAGEMAEATVAETVQDPTVRYLNELVAWVVATLAGWLGGAVTRWFFGRLVRAPGLVVRFLEKLLLALLLASVAVVVVFELDAWLGPHFAVSRPSLPDWTLGVWASPAGRLAVVVGAWAIALATVIVATLFYWQWRWQPASQKMWAAFQPPYETIVALYGSMEQWRSETDQRLQELEEAARDRDLTSLFEYLEERQMGLLRWFWLQWTATAAALTIAVVFRWPLWVRAVVLGLLALWCLPWIIVGIYSLLAFLYPRGVSWIRRYRAWRIDRAIASLGQERPSAHGERHRLEGGLKSKRPEVRVAAIHKLSRLRPAWALDALRPRLNDRDLNVRIAAIRALQSLGDPRALPWLRAHLDGPLWQEARSAIGSIESMQMRTLSRSKRRRS